MARSDEQTNLRLPPELKEWLKEQATAARRSVNAEVVFRLEESRKRPSSEKEQQREPFSVKGEASTCMRR